jgi:hypothetical protein
MQLAGLGSAEDSDNVSINSASATMMAAQQGGSATGPGNTVSDIRLALLPTLACQFASTGNIQELQELFDPELGEAERTLRLK